jgi:dimethylhistidine N-methyltransferase
MTFLDRSSDSNLIYDCAPETMERDPSTAFRQEVLEGLRSIPKRIPSKYFYDARGAKLFEEITKLPEYYLTRTEMSIFDNYLPEMAPAIGPHARVLEFGAGAGIKTKHLLSALDKPQAYIPIDISREQLIESSLELMEQFPALDVLPVCADYTAVNWAEHKDIKQIGPTLIFFPGSTIGNFTPEEAIKFLKQAHSLLDQNGKLLIGFDLRKDPAIIEPAYNDAAGITAQFNLNLIERMNDEFDLDLNTTDFEHYAFFNSAESRIEMHLIATRDLVLSIDGENIPVARGEHITTEYSYKYSSDRFDALLRKAGFAVTHRWHDPQRYFELALATA